MVWCKYLFFVIFDIAVCSSDGPCSLGEVGCVPDSRSEADGVHFVQVNSRAQAFRTKLKAKAEAETKYGTVIELDLAAVYADFHKRRVTLSQIADPTNLGLSFDEFIGFTGLDSELTSSELKLFRERFIDLVSFEMAKDHLDEIPDSEKRMAWFLEEEAIAFELEKPIVTQKQVDIINSDPQIGWNATIKPEFQNTSKDMFHHMLGLGDTEAEAAVTDKDADLLRVQVVSLTDDNSTSEVPSIQEVQLDEDLQVKLPTRFYSWKKWPECSAVLRRVLTQGTCGSCWAFSAASVTDSRLCITSKGQFKGQVSRGFITSCEGQHSSPHGNGCKGGWPHNAFKLIEDAGVPTGAKAGCIPYFGSGDSLKHFSAHDAAPTCPNKCENGASLVDDLYHLSGYGKHKQFHWHHYKNHNVKNELYQNGPISAIIFASNAFMSYSGGVYDGDGCDGNYPANAPNHAVVAIGWEPTSMIMVNSWGQSWGIKGKFYIKFCGVASYEAPGSFSSSGRPAGWDSSNQDVRRRRFYARRRRSTRPGGRGDTSQRRRRSGPRLETCDLSKHGGSVYYWPKHFCHEGCPAKLPHGHVVNCCYAGLCASQEEAAPVSSPTCNSLIAGSSCSWSPCSYWYSGPAKCEGTSWQGKKCYCASGYCAEGDKCVKRS